MAWLLLVLAGCLEVTWSISMKYSLGLTKLGPSVLAVVGSIASFLLLSQAMRTVPVGTAYAIWTGIGAAGTTLLGIYLFGESGSPWRIGFLLLVIVGMIGLKVTSVSPE